MTTTLTIRAVEAITHDTQRVTFDKPDGFRHVPGQAAHIALDKDGWRDVWKSFTMTSLPEDEALEFVIKSYPEEAEGHDGVSQRIARLQPGDTMVLKDVWGAIDDEGDGVFIAGGAGVTPFIAILREKLEKTGSLKGNTLIFSNKAERDILLRDEFDKMPGLQTRYIVTDEPDSPLYRDRIDEALLKKYVEPSRDTCYVCGPPPMLDDISKQLKQIGVPEQRIVMEQFD
ncbi:flavodoxin reductase [Citreicella sp. C3M06]|uniref:FAD-binding oxidoreductase n=1 Tax=Citreicella sp. C3M06 TaxID=2841564 RepID=UPI001C07F85E|nr:FAD-binding oxidoreductase [Citreicella sp. C3M06]MBU2962870.1 flavodoxin reductase [Citreicella sp. C3M06]